MVFCKSATIKEEGTETPGYSVIVPDNNIGNSCRELEQYQQSEPVAVVEPELKVESVKLIAVGM